MQRLEREAIRPFNLPLEPFYRLLSAFSQDVVKTRYQHFGELVDYARRSANPIGRLLLHLYGHTDQLSLAQSDGICTALQLINFWQDVAVDWQKGRVYLPQEDLEKFGVSEAQIAEGRADAAFQRLMAHQCQRAHKMLKAGSPLGKTLRAKHFAQAGGKPLQRLHPPSRTRRERLVADAETGLAQEVSGSIQPSQKAT